MDVFFSREKSDGFKKLLTKLEEEANQTLQSLVTAPMQRITKLPLLMKEILKRTPLDDPNRVQMEATHRATQEVKIRYFRLNEVKVIYINLKFLDCRFVQQRCGENWRLDEFGNHLEEA